VLLQKDLSEWLFAEFTRNDLHLFLLLFALFIFLLFFDVVLLDGFDGSPKIL
jgi:hypothetical protein